MPITIFNRQRVKQHRDRAAGSFGDYNFLLREMVARMVERLPDIKRTFPMALDLGAHTGLLAESLSGEGGIEILVQTDMSEAMLNKASGLRVIADEEFLPFSAGSFDLVMSVGSLHWVNDVPGTLIQVWRILKAGGLFLAMVPGGETLKELRQAFEQAELSCLGGMSPRISPFIDVRDAGSLLQRAGFTMPVTDSEIMTVSYENPLKLVQDLRGMGEANALIAGNGFTSRTVLLAALDYYRQHFSDKNQRVPATFEIVTLTAWKPDAAK